jgi:hypothetical protein
MQKTMESRRIEQADAARDMNMNWEMGCAASDVDGIKNKGGRAAKKKKKQWGVIVKSEPSKCEKSMGYNHDATQDRVRGGFDRETKGKTKSNETHFLKTNAPAAT